MMVIYCMTMVLGGVFDCEYYVKRGFLICCFSYFGDLIWESTLGFGACLFDYDGEGDDIINWL